MVKFDQAAARHLLSRVAFASSPEESARLSAMRLTDAVDSLLRQASEAKAPTAPSWVKTPWVNTERVYPETTQEQRRENHRMAGQRYNVERNSLRCWWLDEMIKTKSPLRETMTLFWHGHFTTGTNKVFISQALYQQNALLRQHALGDFTSLLEAITLDAGMMMYLDMEDSDKAKPNENFARELLELFTLGEGNYTESDIRNIARALTGWTLDQPEGLAPKPKAPDDAPRTFKRDGLVAKFRKEHHDAGEKTVLGLKGNFGVRDIVGILARQEKTGRFLARKMIAFFGVADPKQTLESRMAKVFLEQKTQIAPMIRELLCSEEFFAKESRATLIKSPVQLLVGACRQLQLEVTATPSLAQVTAAMGQELFNPPNVKGWPGDRAWIGTGTLAVRYHLAEALFDGKEPSGLEPIGPERFIALPMDADARRDLLRRIEMADKTRKEARKKDGIQVRFDVAKVFPKGIPESVSEVVDGLMARLLVVEARPDTRDALIATAKLVAKDQRPALVARLILNTPEYQLA